MGQTKDSLLQVMEDHPDIDTFEKAHEYLMGQAEFIAECEKDDRMTGDIDDTTENEREWTK